MKNEILRRILLVAGSLTATTLFCLNSGRLIQVVIEKPPATDRERQTLRSVGPEWDNIVRVLTSPEASEADQYFNPDQSPFPEFLHELAEHRLAYGLIERASPSGTIVLSVHLLEPRGVVRSAPVSVAYPWRRWSYWVLGATIVVYLAIPWPPRLGKDVVQYPRLAAGLFPDLFVALPLVILFFALPFLICQHIGSGDLSLLFNVREGTLFLTMTLWGLAAVSGSIFWISSWYTAYACAVRPDGVWLKTVLGAQLFPFDQIVAVQPSRLGLPNWARRLMWLAPLINWRVLPSLIISERADLRAIDLMLQDGRRIRIPLAGFPDAEQVIHDLQSRCCGQAASLVDQLDQADRLPLPWITAAWIELLRRGFLLTGIGFSDWAYCYTTPELLQITTTGFEREQSRLGDFFYQNKISSMEEYLSYVVQQDANRLTEVSGADWLEFYTAVEQAVSERRVDAWTHAAIDVTVTYPETQAPAVLQKWLAGVGRSESPQFVVLKDGATRRYIAISVIDGHDIAYRNAASVSPPPTEMLHPKRSWTLPLVIFGVVSYAAIPWPRRPLNLIASKLRWAIVKDFFSSVVLIFTVAWTVVFMVPYMADIDQILAEDWLLWAATTGTGTLTVLALTVNATIRAGYGVLLAKDGLARCSLCRIDRLLYADLDAVREVQLGAPFAPGLLVLLGGLVIWPVLPIGILMLTSRATGQEFRFQNGTRAFRNACSPFPTARVAAADFEHCGTIWNAPRKLIHVTCQRRDHCRRRRITMKAGPCSTCKIASPCRLNLVNLLFLCQSFARRFPLGHHGKTRPARPYQPSLFAERRPAQKSPGRNSES